eukprot:jgi/Picsp_1/1328/NSC_04808-R1_protein
MITVQRCVPHPLIKTNTVVQVWLPYEAENGCIELSTRGHPFCVAGSGDLLALFRCLSCRYTFSGEISQPHRLGSPGRVYLTKQPELACNVQEYPENLYLRRSGAQQCSVQSSMLLPIFAASRNDYQESPLYSGVLQQETKHKDDVCLGVIEIVQTSDDMQFIKVAENLHAVMQSSGLSTCSRDDLQALMPKASYLCSNLPMNTGIMMNEKITTSDEFKEAQATSSGDIGDINPVPDGDDANRPIDREGTGGSKFGPNTNGADTVGVNFSKESRRLGISRTRLSKVLKRKGIQEYSIKNLRKANQAIDMAWKGSLEQPAEEVDGIYPDSRWATLRSLVPQIDIDPVFPTGRVPNLRTDKTNYGSLPEGAIAIQSRHYRIPFDSRQQRRPIKFKNRMGFSESKRNNEKAAVIDKDVMIANDGTTAVPTLRTVGDQEEHLPNLTGIDSEIGMMDPSMMDMLLLDTQFAPDLNFTDQELERILELDKS